MFLGSGIKGNRVIGSTDDGQFLHPIDPKTLAIAPDAEQGLRVAERLRASDYDTDVVTPDADNWKYAPLY